MSWSDFIAHLEKIDEEACGASAQELAEVELLFGIVLPKELLTVLSVYGSCGFSQEARVDVESRTLGLFTIFGCSGGAADMVSDWKAHQDYQAEGFVPFADDMFNNRYVLCKNSGRVLFLDYSSSPRTLVVVAGSFLEFVERVYFVPD